MDYIGDLPDKDDLGREHYEGGGDNCYDESYDSTFDFSEREELPKGVKPRVTERLRRRHPK